MGKKAPMKIMKDCEIKPSPKKTKAIGIHAKGGIGRKISIIGLKIDSTFLESPINNPKGTAIIVAK
jgi:hypothetical protein